MTSRVEARVERIIDAAPERAFDAWLDPGSVRTWMAAALRGFGLPGEMLRVEIDPQQGGRFCFSDRRDGVETPHWGTYLELDRPQRLVFTWITSAADEVNPSDVSLDFRSNKAGTEVQLVHRMDAAWAEYVPRVEQGWSRMLDEIAGLLRANEE